MRLCSFVMGLVLFTPQVVVESVQSPSNVLDSASAILQRYGDAWRGGQEMALERDFVMAFWIRGELGGDYHLVLSPEPGADVREGVLELYDVGFELDIELLRRLDRGEINALTAMGQARGGDPIPLVPRMGPLLEATPDAGLQFRRLAFHFWTRGWPEIVPFGERATRLVHGGNAAVLLYDREFRSAWFQLKPGMHVNADPEDQTNEFPQLVIITRGRIKGRFDGQERVLVEGEAILIPAGMRHEFWADNEEYGEAVWIAFGEGA
jgi:mannose-6-phosphate isomerase-like protein (cupin superfamily)